MSTMSASPVKPVMPPPPGVATPPKVIPTAPNSNLTPPGSLPNPVPPSPPKSQSIPPQNSSILPSPSIAALGSSKPISQPLVNMNHTATPVQMPLSLISEHKAASAPVRTPEKQQPQAESIVKPTSNGVEGQASVPHPVATLANIQAQQPPPVTVKEPAPVPPPSAPVNAVGSGVGQQSQAPNKADGILAKQPPVQAAPLPLNVSSPVKSIPVPQSSVSARLTADSNNSVSDSVASPNTATLPQRSETVGGGSIVHSKVEPIPLKKSDQPSPAGGSIEATLPTPAVPQASPAALTTSSNSVTPSVVAKTAPESQKAVEPPSSTLPVKVSSANADGNKATAPMEAAKSAPVAAKPVAEANEPQTTPPQVAVVSNSTPTKSEMRVATIPRGSKRKREPKAVSSADSVQQNVSTPAGSAAEQLANVAKSDALDDRKSKRVRLPTQPYQSPLPEFSLIAKMNKPTPSKSTDDKLIVFYKNEFLAVRNADGGFYICQAMQNIYKSSPKIRIRWLSQEASTEVYSPDFYDTTDFDCILTNLNLERVDKEKFRLPPVELHRTESILKRALDVEKGVSEKPSVTEEHPDGLDLSLFRDESQLKKTPKKAAGSSVASKKPAKKPSRSSTRNLGEKQLNTIVDSDDDEDEESEEEQKKKERKKSSASKVNKKKKKPPVSKKKSPAVTGKRGTAAVKVASTPKASQPKKKKKRAAAAAPVATEPIRPAVKRKRSTSTPPTAPAAPQPSSAKRAKKSDTTTTQAKEVDEKTSRTRNVVATSKNRSGSNVTAVNSAASAEKNTPDSTSATRNSNSAVKEAVVTSGKDSSSPAATNPSATVVAAKENREQRRAAKSRK